MTISMSVFISISRTGRSITKAASPCVMLPSMSLLSRRDGDLHRFSLNTVLREYTTSPLLHKKAWDPSLDQYKYWNREESKKGEASYVLDMSPESIQKEARILCLAAEDDHANNPLTKGVLPFGAKLLKSGLAPDDFDHDSIKEQMPNVLFVSPSCPHAHRQLPKMLNLFPTIDWIHVRSAGIDFLESDELPTVLNTRPNLVMTNAKGQFSSSLAEYVMMACAYFAKDIPRLLRQKGAKVWHDFDITELRGKTMGIVGYGDIGRAAAKLASVYGMRIVALRRNPAKSEFDPICDEVYGTGRDALQKLMSVSDYVVCSAPSTVETRGMVNADAFKASKKGQVFINLGRGPVVDENALLESLKNNTLRGAALDVFATEPLPPDHEFWDMENVLISPHNMDKTATFMHEATEFFVNENLPRFVLGDALLNPVDPSIGY
ncbi:hypothetical protein HJC23_008294 [Cyclotella cryptica]|uniref:D-isomer specific 2-hydroxyacid dehydrogenase NAD-binding domain-containing protein n=1 Tax=Cyclotella cryptica TaxID=29204 RepID=A0ABD3NGR2_9STRA|eukprot:CCRYP_020982-RA/>CCRYP_020982-RA protein AED:0.24 eAED:0.24 QI:45/1/1/1/1/1/3/216/434